MLKEKIKQDCFAAMKAKNEAEVSILRFVNAAILNKEKDKEYKLNLAGKKEAATLTEEEILDVLGSEIKKLRDSLALFTQGNRMDLAQKAQNEIDILTRYLPAQLTEDEIKKLVAEAVKKTGATSIKEMGKVMAELMPQIKGKADGSLVGKLVKESLSSV